VVWTWGPEEKGTEKWMTGKSQFLLLILGALREGWSAKRRHRWAKREPVGKSESEKKRGDEERPDPNALIVTEKGKAKERKGGSCASPRGLEVAWRESGGKGSLDVQKKGMDWTT